jgi:hypothetical protein
MSGVALFVYSHAVSRMKVDLNYSSGKSKTDMHINCSQRLKPLEATYHRITQLLTISNTNMTDDQTSEVNVTVCKVPKYFVAIGFKKYVTFIQTYFII